MDTKRYILLNMDRDSRVAFREGLGEIPSRHFRTRNMLLHISSNGNASFVYKNSLVDWSDATVLTRLRSNDAQFCAILYTYFAHHTIPANDPINQSHTQSDEKISQMLTLALAGIRIPESFIFREESFAKNEEYIREHLTFPAIYKTDGSRGMQVHYVETFEALQAHVAQKQPCVLALVQPFIQNESDVRTVVAYGTVIGAMKRTRTGGYLNNISQGATASAHTPTSEEVGLALHSANVCGIDIAGVDIMHSPDGPVVLEVNKAPQVAGFESVHDFKVFTKIAEILRTKDTL